MNISSRKKHKNGKIASQPEYKIRAYKNSSLFSSYRRLQYRKTDAYKRRCFLYKRNILNGVNSIIINRKIARLIDLAALVVYNYFIMQCVKEAI